VIKIAGDELKNEIQALKDIKMSEEADQYNYPYDYVPEIIDQGEFLSSNSLSSYYVMKQYGISLQKIFGLMGK